MRSSREKVLERLRQARLQPVPLPEVPSSPLRFEDLAGRFAKLPQEACVWLRTGGA